MAYNTTPFHGKLARIEKNDIAIDFTGDYTFNVTIELASVKRQGQHWDENVVGFGSWNASFNGQLVCGNAEQIALINNIVTATPGVKLTDIKFLLDASTNAYSGDVYLVGHGVNTGVGTHCACSFSFIGDGAPTISAAA